MEMTYVWQVLGMSFADVVRVFENNGYSDVEADAFYNSKIEDVKDGFMGALVWSIVTIVYCILKEVENV